MRYHIEEHYQFKGDRKYLRALFDAFDLWAGTNRLAEQIDDFDMALSLGEDTHLVEFTCSVDITPHTNKIAFNLPFNQWAAGIGDAAQEAHAVVQAFIAEYDEDHWEVLSGQTTVTSDGDGDDIENATLAMTIRHGERDLSMLARLSDPESWFSHY